LASLTRFAGNSERHLVRIEDRALCFDKPAT
jgi:hypothetical protein